MERVERHSDTRQRDNEEPRLAVAHQGAQELPRDGKPTGGFVPFCARLKPTTREGGNRGAGGEPAHNKTSCGQVPMVHGSLRPSPRSFVLRIVWGR